MPAIERSVLGGYVNWVLKLMSAISAIKCPLQGRFVMRVSSQFNPFLRKVSVAEVSAIKDVR